jgi:hypothetical protein
MEIDVPKTDRGDVSKDFISRYRPAARAAPLDGLIQFPNVVRDYGVGQQRERTGNQNLFVAPAATIRANRSGMEFMASLLGALTSVTT